jgi:hypothetical protein
MPELRVPASLGGGAESSGDQHSGSIIGLLHVYSDRARRAVHQFLVDAYGAQHPGDGDRRSVQSVALSASGQPQ